MHVHMCTGMTISRVYMNVYQIDIESTVIRRGKRSRAAQRVFGNRPSRRVQPKPAHEKMPLDIYYQVMQSLRAHITCLSLCVSLMLVPCPARISEKPRDFWSKTVGSVHSLCTRSYQFRIMDELRANSSIRQEKLSRAKLHTYVQRMMHYRTFMLKLLNYPCFSCIYACWRSREALQINHHQLRMYEM